MSYVGNLGIQELMIFYQDASPEQIELLEDLLKREKIARAIRLIEDVTGVRLQEGSEAFQINENEVQSNQIISPEYMKDLEYSLTNRFKMDEASLQNLLYRDRNAIRTQEHGTLYEWKDLARALFEAANPMGDDDSVIPYQQYFHAMFEPILLEIQEHYNKGIRYYTWPE